MIAARLTPGVYAEQRFSAPAPKLRTGVPAFLGRAEPAGPPFPVTRWQELVDRYGEPAPGESVPGRYLAAAVRGFFANGGRLCYVRALAEGEGLDGALDQLAVLDDVDLVCAPDLAAGSGPESAVTALAAQRRLLRHCREAGGRFAILDSLEGADAAAVLRHRRRLQAADGALYHPWVRVPAAPGKTVPVPPCGHVAGVYARTDERAGVYKAPANALLEDVLALAAEPSRGDCDRLCAEGVNCLLMLAGRGPRVWGARTLSGEPEWRYVHVRRLVLTLGRWIERRLSYAAFEPNGPRLWARLRRDLGALLESWQERGALRGETPAEGFSVRCDAETNPASGRQAGRVVTEIGLAPLPPAELLIVRVLHGAGGVTLAGSGG